MNSRERVLASLNFEETDRLCYSLLLANYFLVSLPEQGHSSDFYETAEYIGCDIIKRHVPAYRWVYKGVEHAVERHGEEVHDVFTTPFGELRQIRIFHNGTQSLVKKYIQDTEDVKRMIYVVEHTDCEPTFDLFYEEEKRIGERGVATASGPVTPLMDCLQFLMGLEETTYAMCDEEDLMNTFFDALQTRNKKCYSLLAELDCAATIAYEDTSTTMLNRPWMQDLISVHLNEYSDIMHSNGKRFIAHMCGKLSGFHEEIHDLTCDGIDSVCPPTTGDMPIWKAKEQFGKKFIIGGLEPPSLVSQSREQVVRYVGQIIENLKDKRGIILSSGDSVAYGTPIDTLKAIGDYIRFLGPDSLKSENQEEKLKEFFNKYR